MTARNLRGRVNRAADRAAEGRPNALTRVVLAVATAPPAAIYAAAALGDLEALAPGACGGPTASAAAREAARAAAARLWPHLVALWTDLGRVAWPHGLPLDHAAWTLIAVPEPSTVALAEADRVLAAAPAPPGAHGNAHALGVVRAHTARALTLPWAVLDRHTSVNAGLYALTRDTPWSTAPAIRVSVPPADRGQRQRNPRAPS